MSNKHNLLAFSNLLLDKLLVPVEVVLGLVVQKGLNGRRSQVSVEPLVLLDSDWQSRVLCVGVQN